MDPSGNSIETRELTAAQTLAIPHNIPSTGAYQMCFEREGNVSGLSNKILCTFVCVNCEP